MNIALYRKGEEKPYEMMSAGEMAERFEKYLQETNGKSPFNAKIIGKWLTKHLATYEEEIKSENCERIGGCIGERCLHTNEFKSL